MVPVLVLSGVDVRYAVPASLVAIVGTSLGGLRYLFKRGLVSLSVALTLESATIVGAVIGVEVFGRLTSSQLEAILGAVLVVMGFAFIARERLRGEGGLVKPTRLRLLAGAFTSMAAGLASAMLGIGGGVVKVPILVLLIGLPVHVAVATSKLMIGLTALTGVIGHALKTGIDWGLAVPLTVGTFTGATVSSRILVRLRAKTLYYLAASYYYLMGVYMVLRGLGLA